MPGSTKKVENRRDVDDSSLFLSPSDSMTKFGPVLYRSPTRNDQRWSLSKRKCWIKYLAKICGEKKWWNHWWLIKIRRCGVWPVDNVLNLKKYEKKNREYFLQTIRNDTSKVSKLVFNIRFTCNSISALFTQSAWKSYWNFYRNSIIISK